MLTGVIVYYDESRDKCWPENQLALMLPLGAVNGNTVTAYLCFLALLVHCCRLSVIILLAHNSRGIVRVQP